MPFGATPALDGATRFRLWAPGAGRVTLELTGDATRAALPMTALEDGWHEAVVPRCGAGARYAFRAGAGQPVPDPASRCNPDDVHAPSMVVDPLGFDWPDAGWRGRPWEEAIIYELHIGTFTSAGTFAAAIERLDHLVALGVTAIEIMPLAEFAGRRNWGYDGVLPFAPESAYGTPEDLKTLIAAAHARELMVLLDVVYNHLGPEGNYLHTYAPQFFHARHQTPWGAALNFDAAGARTVREFFIHNALYWLEEYHFDGLRVDAVHAIVDESDPHIVAALARAVRDGPGRERHVHFVLENDRNEAHFLARETRRAPPLANAQWNDDAHHAFHVLVAGERDGYYADYAEQPSLRLGRVLAEGFAYQGERSAFRGGGVRGEPSAHLPPTAFVDFLQSHDQVGNRAFGERIGTLAAPEALVAATACVLLAPSVPLLFMGEEFLASTPFLYFCDFGPDLAAAVARGRREEFGRFARFADPELRASIPDPNDRTTFERSRLEWSETEQSPHREWLEFCRALLALRRQHVVPRLTGMSGGGTFECVPPGALAVHWTLGDGTRLHLAANLSAASAGAVRLPGTVIYANGPPGARLAPWSVVWTLESSDA
jgi:maltooligosyltrehalose trehalohydrolase